MAGRSQTRMKTDGRSDGRTGGREAAARSRSVRTTSDSGLLAMPSARAEQPGDAVEVLHPVGGELQCRDAEPAESLGGGAVGARLVQQHQVGFRGDDRLDIGIDPVAEVGHRGGLGGIVAPGGASHQPMARAEREDQLGGRGHQRHDAGWRRGERERDAGVVDQLTGNGGRRRPAAAENGKKRERAEDAMHPDPPPREQRVTRPRRSPGLGLPLAFPVSQWRGERGMRRP